MNDGGHQGDQGEHEEFNANPLPLLDSQLKGSIFEPLGEIAWGRDA